MPPEQWAGRSSEVQQIRLYVRSGEDDIKTVFALLSDRFEEEGYPVSTFEIDEDRNIWEASLYAPQSEKADVWQAMSDCLTPMFPDLGVRIEDLPDIDWVSHVLEDLQPVRAGRFLVHGSHDRNRVRPGDLAIEIDAGQAFGTGHHGTTAGCLEMIEQVLKRRPIRNALDLGTGSGVLAMGIARSTVASIVATDIDPIAAAVARHNIQKNRCTSQIDVRTATGFHDPVFAGRGPFDLIVANILARPLMGLAPSLTRHLATGGEVILSGILAEQRWRVLAAYANQGLYHRRTLWRDGWVTLLLER